MEKCINVIICNSVLKLRVLWSKQPDIMHSAATIVWNKNKTFSTIMDYLGWEFSNLDHRLSFQLSFINNITIPKVKTCSLQ